MVAQAMKAEPEGVRDLTGADGQHSRLVNTRLNVDPAPFRRFFYRAGLVVTATAGTALRLLDPPEKKLLQWMPSALGVSTKQPRLDHRIRDSVAASPSSADACEASGEQLLLDPWSGLDANLA